MSANPKKNSRRPRTADEIDEIDETVETDRNRPHRKEPTRPVRVPISLIPEIRALLRRESETPLFEQTVPAGFPSPAENYEYEGLNIVSYLIPRPENAFLVRVGDDRLNRYGLFAGDLAIVRRDLAPTPTDLVVIEREGEIALIPFSDRLVRTALVRGVVRFAIRRPF